MNSTIMSLRQSRHILTTSGLQVTRSLPTTYSIRTWTLERELANGYLSLVLLATQYSLPISFPSQSTCSTFRIRRVLRCSQSFWRIQSSTQSLQFLHFLFYWVCGRTSLGRYLGHSRPCPFFA